MFRQKSGIGLKNQDTEDRFWHVIRLSLCTLCTMLLIILADVPVCVGQSFGKNKVSNRQFDWMTYKTTHFTIYYYPDEERLVRTMADMAEIAYAKISTVLEHNIKKTTPLILYKSHGDFQQTNVILEPLGEGVGGFAELLKYRIVIPFTGSIDEFQKVITHEITHIFQYDILYKDLFAHIYTGEFLRSPPLWFIEGMAEYMADHWDAEGRMVLRDAVITNSIVPLTYLQDFSPLGTRVYQGYKQGQSAVEYLAEKYGADKLGGILRELGISKSKDLDNALKNAIGIGLEEFDKDWRREIKKRYWPKIADKQNPDTIGKNLTEKDRNAYSNTKPVWSPSGDLLAYITTRDGYEEIRIISAKDGELLSRLTNRTRGEHYDSIREEGSGLAWSPNGDQIAFVGVKNDRDYVLVVDVINGEPTSIIEMPFDAAYSPAWSPDNKKLAIVGLKDGRSDLYILDLDDKQLKQITSDIYDDMSPAWHPTEPGIIAYSSERDGRYKIFTLNLDTGQTQQITYGSQNDVSPSWSYDGKKLVFCSDMNGIYDVYTVEVEHAARLLAVDGDLIRLTNILTGCFNPVFSPSDDKLAMSIYYDYKSNIYILDSRELLKERVPMPSQEKIEKPLYVVDDRGVRGVDYSLSFSPDLIYVDFGYISGGGFQNTVQFVGSDIMGDHRFMAGVDSISFQTQPEFFLAYYYLKRRPDFGAGIFNWYDFFIEGEERFWQRSTGIAGYMSYPLDRFNRIDLMLERNWRFLEFVDEEEERTSRESVTLFGLSLVKDVVTWSDFGPYTGMRYNLSLEQTVKLSDQDLKMTNAILDLRKYFRLGQRTNFAVRFIGAASLGADKEEYHLGSSFQQGQGGFYFTRALMRGYDFEEVSGNRVGLLNLELRIPFVDELRFGWPFVWGISGIRGVLFMDFAGVWPRPAESTDIHGNPIVFESQFKPWVTDDFRLMDLRSSVGAGFRIGLGYLWLSFDFAKKTNLRNLGKGYKFHFGLGPEF